MGPWGPLVWALLGAVLAAEGVAGGGTNCTGVTATDNCEDGILVPLWRPFVGLTTGDKMGRALIYFIAIIYMFLGLSIVSDRFMASIEVITSKEREIKVKRPDGEVFTVTVRIWNETVSNLTLMALGSSAPEIMLSVIEVCGHGFKAGALGPNTIVGSAAFNLFMIIAICVAVIPEGEVRRQKHLSVFFVTASMSIFAYLWLYVILAVISYGVIEIWEGVVTFCFFPLTVGVAYVADTKMIVNKFLARRYRSTSKGIIATEGTDVELQAVEGAGTKGYLAIPQDPVDPAVKAFEEHRREFIELMKELRQKHPNTEPDALQQMAEVEMINRGPKSRAFYRVQATRKLVGGGNIVKKKIAGEHVKDAEAEKADEAAAIDRFQVTRPFLSGNIVKKKIAGEHVKDAEAEKADEAAAIDRFQVTRPFLSGNIVKKKIAGEHVKDAEAEKADEAAAIDRFQVTRPFLSGNIVKKKIAGEHVKDAEAEKADEAAAIDRFQVTRPFLSGNIVKKKIAGEHVKDAEAEKADEAAAIDRFQVTRPFLSGNIVKKKIAGEHVKDAEAEKADEAAAIDRFQVTRPFLSGNIVKKKIAGEHVKDAEAEKADEAAAIDRFQVTRPFLSGNIVKKKIAGEHVKDAEAEKADEAAAIDRFQVTRPFLSGNIVKKKIAGEHVKDAEAEKADEAAAIDRFQVTRPFLSGNIVKKKIAGEHVKDAEAEKADEAAAIDRFQVTRPFLSGNIVKKKIAGEHVKDAEAEKADEAAAIDRFQVTRPFLSGNIVKKKIAGEHVKDAEAEKADEAAAIDRFQVTRPFLSGNIVKKKIAGEHVKDAEAEKADEAAAIDRFQVTRPFLSGNIVKKKIAGEHVKDAEAEKADEAAAIDRFQARVFFDPAHYTVLENVGTFSAVVTREGGPEGLTVMVDYATEDGTANAGSDYRASSGTLTFGPLDRHQTIPVEIIDDDVFEEDEHFMIHLRNLRVQTKDGLVIDPAGLGGLPVAALEMPATATVMILDDDHAGVFAFDNQAYEIVESAGKIHLRVQRHSGARGKVLIPYRTLEGSAKPDTDYEAKEGELVFDNDETEKFIELGVVDKEEYERSDSFYVELDEPIWAKKLSDQDKLIERYLRRKRRKQTLIEGERAESQSVDSEALAHGEEDDNIADLGKPRLGDIVKATITIKESKELKGVVDNMMKKANASLVLGTSSWREQFVEALSVTAGDEDGEEEEEEGADGAEVEVAEPSGPSCSDYIMHFISVPWKVVFAFIPPTDYFGGWACFVISILGIGALTAVVGDLASHFGCTIGLKDAVTAITFVALGTSVPDTFASKVAAVQDKYADSSIGNVTGSNAVNVFLGIGIAWTIAAVYHAANGDVFRVEPGTLAFSVTIFCIEALVCIALLLIRRHPSIGGELGGAKMPKYATAAFMTFLWVLYVTLASLESYCIIPGF